MNPKERLAVLCDAFRQKNSSELRLFLHSLLKSTNYLIEQAYPLLKKIPGIDLSSISNIELHVKALNFELNHLRSYMKVLESMRDTPKAIVLIDDEVIQKFCYQERCLQKNIQFSYYGSVSEFLSNKSSHSPEDMIVIDWYLGQSTADQVVNELAQQGFNNLYITSSIEVDISPYQPIIKGYLPKNPSWL